MTAPLSELRAEMGDARDTRPVAPIATLCERAGWWRMVDVDCWVVCSDPALDSWRVWRRLTTDRTRARADHGFYPSADAAVRAARGE